MGSILIKVGYTVLGQALQCSSFQSLASKTMTIFIRQKPMKESILLYKPHILPVQHRHSK